MSNLIKNRNATFKLFPLLTIITIITFIIIANVINPLRIVSIRRYLTICLLTCK